MLVSIVIPTYNGEKYLAQTLGSVQSQTCLDWELLVVDDGSSDSTPALVQGFADQDPRIRLIRQTNGGIARARNSGAKAADPSSEYLCFLDHDDIWKPEALRLLLEAARSCPACVGAHGLMCVIDSDGKYLADSELEKHYGRRLGLVGTREVQWESGQPTTFAVEAYNHIIYTVGQALIRKATFHALGGFDPETVPCDDFDFWVRLTLQGNLAFVNQAVVEWRTHDTNTSNRKDRMEAAAALVCNKIVLLPDLNKEQRFLATQCLIAGPDLRKCYQRREWARAYLRQGHFLQAALQFRHAYRHYLNFHRICSSRR